MPVVVALGFGLEAIASCLCSPDAPMCVGYNFPYWWLHSGSACTPGSVNLHNPLDPSQVNLVSLYRQTVLTPEIWRTSICYNRQMEKIILFLLAVLKGKSKPARILSLIFPVLACHVVGT